MPEQNDEQLMQEWNLSPENLEMWASRQRIGKKAQVAKELLDRRNRGVKTPNPEDNPPMNKKKSDERVRTARPE